MTIAEAKQVLLRYRPGTTDTLEPEVAEALRLASVDPELGSWLKSQQEFQSHARAQLRGVQPAASLKETILRRTRRREIHTSRPSRLNSESPAVDSYNLSNSRTRNWLALAALILFILIPTALLIMRPSGEQSFTAFRSRMVNFALRTYQMDIVTNNPAAITRYIGSQGASTNFTIPANLAKTPVKGGGRLTWQNKPVSMICYTLPTNKTLFVFVIDQTALRGNGPTAEPKLQPDARLTTVAFNRDNHTFLMAGEAPPQTLLALASDSPLPP